MIKKVIPKVYTKAVKIGLDDVEKSIFEDIDKQVNHKLVVLVVMF